MTSPFRTDHLISSPDTTDEEAKNQFLEEIELMKVIGSHRNIVSMLGCWVNSDPIFLVLEYVPYGDLLHWLRNKRIQVNLILHEQGGAVVRAVASEQCDQGLIPHRDWFWFSPFSGYFGFLPPPKKISSMIPNWTGQRKR